MNVLNSDGSVSTVNIQGKDNPHNGDSQCLLDTNTKNKLKSNLVFIGNYLILRWEIKKEFQVCIIYEQNISKLLSKLILVIDEVQWLNYMSGGGADNTMGSSSAASLLQVGTSNQEIDQKLYHSCCSWLKQEILWD